MVTKTKGGNLNEFGKISQTKPGLRNFVKLTYVGDDFSSLNLQNTNMYK